MADVGAGVMPTSEKAKMLAGEPYDALAPELTAERRRAQRLLLRYNATSPDEGEARASLLRELRGAVGDGCVVGAGSVVTHDLPAGSLAVGNPGHIIRSLG